MLKRTEKYVDFNGNERTEDYYFNLNEAELMEMELTTEGGLAEMIQRVVDAQDVAQILKVFKSLVLKAYGKKSADGKRFEKSEEISREFEQSPVYPRIFMELATDAQKAADFINGIVPADVSKKMAKAELQVNN